MSGDGPLHLTESGACDRRHLFGTGVGIAFFMLMAHRTRDAALVAHTATVVVVADTIFTASAVVLQPVTGAGLARLAGFPLFGGWMGLSLVLYIVTGVFWLPVVWMQLRMRNLAREAVHTGQPLPSAYFHLFRLWFAFGFPAFAAVVGIIWLMVAKPDLQARHSSDGARSITFSAFSPES